MERIAKVRRQQQRKRARRLLLGASVRVFHQIARAFPETHHGRRRQLDVQSAKPGHDTGRHRDGFFRRGRRLAVRRDGLRRREDLDREDFLERIGLVAQVERSSEPARVRCLSPTA